MCSRKNKQLRIYRNSVSKVENGRVKVEEDVIYLSAEEEDEHIIAQANSPFDKKGNLPMI